MGSEPSAHTRGFLFADLRGYSAFTERHGDQAARELLTRYRRSVRDVIGKFDGAEIRTEGDSFYVVFDSVSQAVRAGLAILVAVAEPSADATTHPVPVGIGVHAGEAEDSAEGIVSSAVNVAARICAQAQPGELLVSDTVRALTRGYLDVSFQARGRRHLKGIAEPVALYRVVPGRAAIERGRGDRVRSALVGRRLQRAGVAAAGAVAVLAIAIIGGTLLRESVARQGPSASASFGSSPPETHLTGGASTASPVATDSAFPTETEKRLLARLDETIARHCVRPDEADVPVYRRDVGPSSDQPLPYDAGLECRLGLTAEPDTVWFWSAVPGQYFELVSAIFFQEAGRRSLPPGDCATADVAVGRWELGAAQGGLLCYGSRNATLMWTYDD
ncbi:MAG: adenylate cyclase, partial [Chloroflexota bacterium]|nr:adenylate cyclase [Chloroflexota bacterium]